MNALACRQLRPGRRGGQLRARSGANLNIIDIYLIIGPRWRGFEAGKSLALERGRLFA